MSNTVQYTQEEFQASPYFIENDRIYEVSVGHDPLNDMRFTVGKTYLKNTPSEVKITSIEYDHNSFIQFGQRRIYIHAETKNGSDIVWKIIENQPCIITCKI